MDWAIGWMVQGSNPGRGSRFFSSPKCPAQLRGPLSLFFKWIRGLLPGGKLTGAGS